VISPWIIRFIDFFTAVSTLLVMWKAPTNRNWWALYIVSSMAFVGLMLYKGVWFWAITGVILIVIGWRNYVGKT
jgi:hypothetical protein